MTGRIHSFAPLAAGSAHTLILGTMPGIASLAAAQYYAHPRNQFWPILGAVLGFPADAPYPVRAAALLACDIALWDVLASCTRRGSLDSNITSASIVANDFSSFFARHSRIRRVIFNGNGAATLYRRHVLNSQTVPDELCYFRLPSTSPANASIPNRSKAAAWRAVIASLQ